MRGARALRHQLVTDQQQDIYDYWLELAGQVDGLPHRRQIDPVRIRRQLPFISLYKRGTDDRFEVRLAGTGYWNVFGAEITGRSIDDLPLGEGCRYWNRVLSHVEATGLPMAGTTAPNTPIGSHLRQFWMRLPLENELILGFDQFLRAPDRQPSRLMRPVFGTGTPMLATV